MTTDHLESPRVITNENGEVTSRKDFSAFGEVNYTAERTQGLGYDASSEETRKGYTGYEKDDESGLDFAQARYYNAVHGRYTSVDPLNESGALENPQTLNRYSYVINDPLSLVDPSGMLPEGSSGCSAEYSYEQCGGDAGFWGGEFGDDVAYHNQTFGDLPQEMVIGLRLHLQRISNSQAGYGFVSNEEVFESLVATFDIFYSDYDESDPQAANPRFYAGALPQIYSFLPVSWVRLNRLRDMGAAMADNATFGQYSRAQNAASQYFFGTDVVKTDTKEYADTDTVVTLSMVVLPGPGGKAKAAQLIAKPRDATRVLKLAKRWLGKGYIEIAPGVFRKGLRQFRMTAADLLGKHGKIGAHVHFEVLDKAGKVIKNYHVPLL